MNDTMNYFMHITAPSSCIKHNSESFNSLHQQVSKPIESLNSNLNGMSFIINQLNSHLKTIYKSDESFSNSDLQSSFDIIKQLYNSFKSLNRVTENQITDDSKPIGEFQVIYGQFIKYTIKCIKNLVLPDDLYMQIYASLTPSLCFYLRKLNGESIDISLSDFNILIRLNEESTEDILHFLSENRFETLIDKLSSQISSNVDKHSPLEKYQTIFDLLESIKQTLIPRPQKSDKYKTAINLLEDLKYNMTLYCENDISKSVSSIFILISHIESIIKSLRLGYLSKESLKSLIKYITTNEFKINIDPIDKIPKKFINDVIRLYLQEVKSLRKHKLIDDSFSEKVENILNMKSDYHEFLETVPSYYETSVINEMSRSFSHFDILTTAQLKKFDDCCNMYIKFSREADDFNKGSKLHYNLMKNLIIAESEVIFNTCLNQDFPDQKSIEKVDPIISLIDDIISIINNLATQKQIIITYLTHILKVIQLAFISIKNPEKIQIIKDFLASRIPSFESIDDILGIKQKIGDLLILTGLYNAFENQEVNPKTVDEIFENRKMKEQFQITDIQKQRQIPEMILRNLDYILPYKDFPSKYEQLIEMIGGSAQNCFKDFVFDQDVFNISNCLLNMICSLKGHFELSGGFFFDWLKIIFSMLDNENSLETIPKFSEIIPFFDFSFIFSKIILTFNITRIMINQQFQSLPTKISLNPKENEAAMIESVESLRSYIFSVLKNLDVDICSLCLKINDVKDKARKYLSLNYYRRIKDQMDFIEINMIILSEFNNLTALLTKKYPDEFFDYRPVTYINYALSIYQLLSSINESKCLSEKYLSNFEKLKPNAEAIFEIVKKSKFFSPELNETLSNFIIPFVSEIHRLIKSFDVTSLVDITYEYVYSILDFFNSKQTGDPISPEMHISILRLNFILESISPKASIFQNTDSIASILFTLFSIKQQPPQLDDLYERLRETVITSFIMCNLFDIINFIHHILVEKFGFIKVFQSESDFDLVEHVEEADDIENQNKYSNVSEIVSQTLDDLDELKQCFTQCNFLKESQSFFEKVGEVISPFLEPNEHLTIRIEENKRLMSELRSEKKAWKSKTEEAEKSFVKTRKNCHKAHAKIEAAILEEKKLMISIEQKKKHLVELHSQIEKKEREMAIRNERTPPEMKQKQKVEFMDTIHSLRELVGPTVTDEMKVAELTQKLKEMNEKNDKIRQEIVKLDSFHSTTQEDEIDLLMMTEDSNFTPSSNSENAEEENELLEKKISELEASNDRIRRKLKKISQQNKKPNISTNGLNTSGNLHLSPTSSSIGLKQTNQSNGMNFISGADRALVSFLHSTRPYSYNNAAVDYESFMEFKNSTLERINQLMLKRQQLIEKRDSMKVTDESSIQESNEN